MRKVNYDIFTRFSTRKRLITSVAILFLLASCQGMVIHHSTEELTMSKDTKTYCLGRGGLILPADVGLLVNEPYLDYRGTSIIIRRVNNDTTFQELARWATLIKNNFQNSLQPYAGGGDTHYALLVEQSGTAATGEWWFGYRGMEASKDRDIRGEGYILLSDRLITFFHSPHNMLFPVSEINRHALGDSLGNYMKGLIDSHHLLEPGQPPSEPALCYGDGYFTGAEETAEKFGGGLSFQFPDGSRARADVETANLKVRRYDPKETPLANIPGKTTGYIISKTPVVRHRMVDGMDGEERVTTKIATNGGWFQDDVWLFFSRQPDKPHTVFRMYIRNKEEVIAQDTAWNLILNGWRTHQ